MEQALHREGEAARLASAVRDARARILWGEPVSAVLDAMMEAGVEGGFARTVVDAAMKERGAEIRKSGIRELVIGGAIFVAGAAFFLAVVLSGVYFVVTIGGSLTIVVYGLFRMLKGVSRLIAGPHAALDVSDL